MGKKIILGVDDIAMNLRSLKVILEEDYDVRLAKSGELALDMLKQTKVDLVLMDIEMPGMTGFEAIDNMKKIPGCEEIPVVFITSHAAPDLIMTAYEHGARDYIVKPINPEVLRNKVQALLSKSDRCNTP
jgi:putative two-component system response regulator